MAQHFLFFSTVIQGIVHAGLLLRVVLLSISCSGQPDRRFFRIVFLCVCVAFEEHHRGVIRAPFDFELILRFSSRRVYLFCEAVGGLPPEGREFCAWPNLAVSCCPEIFSWALHGVVGSVAPLRNTFTFYWRDLEGMRAEAPPLLVTSFVVD